MQADPKHFFKQNGIYVIIERDLDTLSHIRVIGITNSYEDAIKYAGPNRIIDGPVPNLSEQLFIQPIKAPHIPYPAPRKDFEKIFDPPRFIEKNPFEPIRPETTPFGLPNINPFDQQNSNPFEQTKPINVNPFRQQKQQNDFSMLTPPPSRVNSNASSPMNEHFF